MSANESRRAESWYPISMTSQRLGGGQLEALQLPLLRTFGEGGWWYDVLEAMLVLVLKLLTCPADEFEKWLCWLGLLLTEGQ